MHRNKMLFLLLACLTLAACGGDTGGGGDASGPGFSGTGFSWGPNTDVAGTPRAKPLATIGAMEVI